VNQKTRVGVEKWLKGNRRYFEFGRFQSLIFIFGGLFDPMRGMCLHYSPHISAYTLEEKKNKSAAPKK